jgi:hypothetical protein
MRLFTRLSVVVLSIGLAALSARAQSAGRVAMAAPGAAGSPADALPAMRAALRALVAREESYFADHGSYTTDLAALGFYEKGRRLSPDSARVQVLFAGGRGWTAMATHRAAPGKSCVAFVGSKDDIVKVPETRGERKQAVEEGVPTCDER